MLRKLGRIKTKEANAAITQAKTVTVTRPRIAAYRVLGGLKRCRQEGCGCKNQDRQKCAPPPAEKSLPREMPPQDFTTR